MIGSVRYRGYYRAVRKYSSGTKKGMALVGIDFTYNNNSGGILNSKEVKITFLEWMNPITLSEANTLYRKKGNLYAIGGSMQNAVLVYALDSAEALSGFYSHIRTLLQEHKCKKFKYYS